MKMQRNNGVALWSQIASQLAHDIQNGAHEAGGRLPTEAQLAESYGVNRHTIRRALDELNEARIIRTEHGRGSFVAEDVLDYRIGKRPRFSEWVRGHNMTPIGEVLELRELAVSDLPEAGPAGEALKLAPDDSIILLERLGSADDRPVAVSRHIFPALPGLVVALRAQNSIKVCARLPDAREAKFLRMARTDPLLATETLNATESGQLTEYGIACYPAPRVQLVFEQP
jgi:GntR family phosphonate transport system transcriptional regulator